MKKRLLFYFLYFAVVPVCFSQDTITPIKVPAKILNGDTIPSLEMNTMIVFPPQQDAPADKKELEKYIRLVYNVRKVYPYAKLAAAKLDQYRKVLDTIPSERKRKAYIKKAQKELESKFGDEIKNLSFSQGKILIKLVYRQTGNSTYDIVKDLRGSFSAFIWQTMARLFGYDLKKPYDPEGEDQAIEKIVRMIDAGS